MRRKQKILVGFFMIVLVFFVLIAKQQYTKIGTERVPFSIVVIPDSQQYTSDDPELFFAQTRWIVGERDRLNTQFVLHAGDITNNNNESEWQVANMAMNMIDRVIPYSMAIGNHCIGGTPPTSALASDRSATLYNRFFGPQRFDNKWWYGGHFQNGNENNYAFFNVDGLEFMVVTLEFGPRDKTLAWANAIVSEHPDKRVIVLTHAYLSAEKQRLSDQHRAHNATNYLCCTEDANDGEEIWDKFVKLHKNIFMVVSGHEFHDDGHGHRTTGGGYLTSAGIYGNPVHQLLINHQLDGYGWLRILRFIPRENKIVVEPDTPLRLGGYTQVYRELTEQNYFDSPLGFTLRQQSDFAFELPYDMSLSNGGH